MAKNNFLLSDSWYALFANLPDEMAGKLIKAAFSYHSGEETEIDDPVLNAVFLMIKNGIDENDRKYEEVRQKRADAGKSKHKVANDSKCNQMITNDSKCNQTDPVYVSDSVSVSDIKEKEYPSDIPKRTRKKSVAESRIGKEQYGDEVYLTIEQYMKLVDDYGTPAANRMIEMLDGYKVANGKTYLDDYRAILNWVVDKYKRENPQPKDTVNEWLTS